MPNYNGADVNAIIKDIGEAFKYFELATIHDFIKEVNRFCLTFLRKMAQILSGRVMILYKLNIKKGKLNMNKTEFVEAVAKTSGLTKVDAGRAVAAADTR